MWPFSESKEPLPLIRCPVCDVGLVKRFVSRTAKNPGRPFYRCEYQGKGGCSFWKWEEEYAAYLRARWGHITSVPAAAAGPAER